MLQIIFGMIIIITLLASWEVYRKMGFPGWYAIIPLFNCYVLFREFYGNGWRFLLLFIPLYNIYLTFVVNIEMARRFGRSKAFGICLTLFGPIFLCILAYDVSRYLYCESK